MKGEWAYYKSIFTPEACNKILEDGLKLPVKDASLGVIGENTRDDYRRSKVRFIQKYDPTFEWLFDELWKMAIESNDLWFGFHISKIDYIQLAEYDESYQGEYKKHHDVFWMNNDPNYHRKLTCVVQLTDPKKYKGCDLELFISKEPTKMSRDRGYLVMFPSYTLHKVTPIEKGTRHSLVGWITGKPFK